MKRRLNFLMFFMVFLFMSSVAFATSIQVTWNANTDSDLSGYKVYYGTTSTGSYTKIVDVGNVTAYSITNPTTGVTYYVAVTAYDTTGNESEKSTEVSVYVPVPDTTAPAVPSKPSVTVSKNSAVLTWTAVTDSDLAGYGIYDNGTLIATVGVMTSPTYTATSLVDGSHVFTLDSFDTTGNRSAKSSGTTVTVDTTAPSAPTNPKITISK